MPLWTRTLVLAMLVLSQCSSAHAWSDAGHKIIAAIAWRQLRPEQRHEVLRLLSHHPRYEEDFLRQQPESLTDEEDRHEWLFQQAAVWPDITRGLPELEKTRFHRSTWHYINKPLFLTPTDERHGAAALQLNQAVIPPRAAEETMNIVQAIRFARRELAHHEHPVAERALWLTWLFHTVGDVHQPLHSTTMINVPRLPDGDRGGNAIPTKQRGNLHALWDGFPGGRVQLAESRQRALTWLHDPELLAATKNAARELNEEVWLRESQQLSETVVYDDEVRTFLKQLPAEKLTEPGPRLELTEEYLERGGHLSRRRILQAGLRLGAVLDRLFP
ncbi:MAG: S1/P1 nuclease [Planctomycetaceae bacterium]|nr:S1/P1 nuclease [Planctomycetaceae bacterium]